jgi:glycosyltransferase involved in cell wall biosynthesis
MKGGLCFAFPGDLDTLTGGYLYDKRIIQGLRAAGWEVETLSLSPLFPHPDGTALAQARRALSALPDGMAVLIDGLAHGAMPEIAREQSTRLCLIALVHHPLAEETGVDAATAARLCDSERQALAAVRRVIVTSPITARTLVQRYGVAESSISVVEPGTEPAPLARGSGSDTLELLCVASLTPRKGHAVLFDALGRLRDRPWRLSCAGSATLAPEVAEALRDQAQRLGLAERICFLGELRPAQLPSLYDRADMFVLASYLEGYGMALAEALARGLPVVSTRAGAIPDTVPAEAGILVEPGDAAALAGALAQVLDDRRLRERLAAGARSARTRLPTWEGAAERFALALRKAVSA